jgi:hypothetical protein
LEFALGGNSLASDALVPAALNFCQQDLHRHSTAKAPSGLFFRTTRHPIVLRKGLDSISVSGAFAEQSQQRINSSIIVDFV